MRVAEPPLFLRRVVARYVRAFAPERIVLFGSYAKGKNGPASDVDLLIVTTVDTGAIHLAKRARQLAADCFPCVDVVFATPDDLEHADTAASPFLMSILGSGVTIYQRGPAVQLSG